MGNQHVHFLTITISFIPSNKLWLRRIGQRKNDIKIFPHVFNYRKNFNSNALNQHDLQIHCKRLAPVHFFEKNYFINRFVPLSLKYFVQC